MDFVKELLKLGYKQDILLKCWFKKCVGSATIHIHLDESLKKVILDHCCVQTTGLSWITNCSMISDLKYAFDLMNEDLDGLII